jgi:hypothetical protein
MSNSRGLRIVGPMRALASLSDSILVSLPLYFLTQTFRYLCNSFVTQ